MAEFALHLEGQDQLRIGERVHPVQISPAMELEGVGRYRFSPVVFLDETSEQQDAGLFHLPPNAISRTVLITGEVEVHDTAIEGSGFVLTLNPLPDRGNEYDVHYLDSNPGKYVLRYESNTLVTYLAAARGLTLLGLYRPPFTDDMEVVVSFGQTEIGGLQIPKSYWSKYRSIQAHR